MVAWSDSPDPDSLYRNLAALVEWGTAHTGAPLCFHNIVNGMVGLQTQART